MDDTNSEGEKMPLENSGVNELKQNDVDISNKSLETSKFSADNKWLPIKKMFSDNNKPDNESQSTPSTLTSNDGDDIWGIRSLFDSIKPVKLNCNYNSNEKEKTPSEFDIKDVSVMNAEILNNANQLVLNADQAGYGSKEVSSPNTAENSVQSTSKDTATNRGIRNKAALIDLDRYPDDLLFYLFYLNVGDLQDEIADRLYNRGWRYHMEEQAWINTIPGMIPFEKSVVYEKSMYYYFDVKDWKIVAKVFQLEYSKMGGWPRDNN